ncbi:MAG: hypothetical protein PHC38_05815, partial [Weeksellaceae bacterium]|nr:hypothetical protein [Weeksellaceae bacterium]
MESDYFYLNDDFWKNLEKLPAYASLYNEFTKNKHIKYIPSPESVKYHRPCFFYDFYIAVLLLCGDENTLTIDATHKVSRVGFYKAYGESYREGVSFFSNRNFNTMQSIVSDTVS